MYTKRVDKIIVFLLSLWLFVDTFNGFFLREGMDIPLSQIYKGVVSVLVFIRCRSYATMTNFASGIFCYVTLYIISLLANGTEVGKSLVLLSKLITSCIFYIYFLFLIKKYGITSYTFFNTILWRSYIIFAINILIGLFGLGYNSYADMDGIGHCGYFYAINELSGVVTILFPFVLYQTKVNSSTFFYYCFLALNFLLAYLLSTKSCLLVVLVSTIAISYFYGEKKERKIVLVLTAVGSLAVVSYIGIILRSNNLAIERFMYFADKNGWIGAITSGRFDYWQEKSRIFFHSDFFTQLVGVGGNLTVEMDLFDALLNIGYIGVFAYIMMFVVMIWRAFISKHKFAYTIRVSFLLLLFISLFSGHILFSSMAGMLIAIFCAITTASNRKSSKHIYNENTGSVKFVSIGKRSNIRNFR